MMYFIRIMEYSRNVVAEITVFWEKCGLPVMESRSSTRKLKQFHDVWTSLKKNCRRKCPSKPLQVKLSRFVGALDDLFDISHHEAMAMIDEDETRQFLLCQRRKGRVGSIGPAMKAKKLATEEYPEPVATESVSSFGGVSERSM